MEDTFRVTVANLQTGIGTTRGYWNYLTTAHRYLFPHDSVGVSGAARYLRAERIGLATFCEIEAGSRRTRELNQVQLLADSTELRRYFFFPTFVTGRRINMGDAVCSRYPVHPIRNHRLPGKGEPRFVSEAEVMSPGGAIRAFVTHLSLERKIRVPQSGRDHRLASVGRLGLQAHWRGLGGRSACFWQRGFEALSYPGVTLFA